MSRLVLLRAACLPFEALGGLARGAMAETAAAVLAATAEAKERAAALADPLFSAAGPPGDDEAATRARFALLRVHARERPRAADLESAAPQLGALLRTALDTYGAALDGLAAAEAAHRSSFEDGLAGARRALCALVAVPMVEHGMDLASRSLVPKVRKLARSSGDRWRHEERHTAAKAAAYVTRFATKTSPNGVFCAVAPAWIGGRDAWTRGTGGVARSEILLSLAEVRKVTACLARDPDVTGAVVPRPNPTLRESAGEWTWWRPATPRDPTDEEVHSRARDQHVLRVFVEEAGRGHLTGAALAKAVAERTGHPGDATLQFLERLVEAGILVAELEVPWSSRRRFRELAAQAARAGTRPEWAAALERIEDEVDRLPALPFPARTKAMEQVARQVEALPRRREFKADELFRVDSATALDVHLPASVHDDLRRAMSRYTPLLATLYPQEVQQRRLFRRFLELQPPDVEVPFLDVYGPLAEPAGPQAPGPLMEFRDPGPGATASAREVFDGILARAEAARPGEEVELDLRAGAEPAWRAGVLFQVAAASAADVAAGRYRLVLNAVFNGVGLALSRFAHLLRDPEGEGPVVAELRRAWVHAARPEAVLAELTYNHEARTANAGLRPVLFEHEIELPGDRVSDGVRRVPLSDLRLRFESATERLVLTSASTGREIVPVLTSGVSPSGIVSTLIHIGSQGTQAVGYLPGFEAPGIVHWPRFCCGRVVLFRERWVLGLTRIPVSESADAAYHLAVARWRADLGLPRHVFVHTSIETKPFYVDLDSPVLLDLLRRAAAGVAGAEGGRMVVTEMLPAPEDLWVRDPAGSYATEFLVQMEGPAAAGGETPRTEAGVVASSAQPSAVPARDSSS